MTILTFMQNQTEIGKVTMTNRKDKMVRSHSQTPRPGVFTPGEKSNMTMLGKDCSQNSDDLTSACTDQLQCCPLPKPSVYEPFGFLWSCVKEQSLPQVARSCQDGLTDFVSALLAEIEPCFSIVP